MGGENTEDYRSSRMHILSCLGSEWTRYNEWAKTTGKDPHTFNKHRKQLLLDGLVEIRKESRRMIFYRRTSEGETLLRGYRVQGLIEQGNFDDLGPDTVKLYTDFDLDLLNDDERLMVDDNLFTLNYTFSKIQGILGEAYTRNMINKHYTGNFDNLDLWIKNGLLHDSLERRRERSIDSEMSDDEIRALETAYLKLYKLNKKEDNHTIWVRMNKYLRKTPLTSEDLELLSELRKLKRELDEHSEINITNPTILVTLFSEDILEF